MPSPGRLERETRVGQQTRCQGQESERHGYRIPMRRHRQVCKATCSLVSSPTSEKGEHMTAHAIASPLCQTKPLLSVWNKNQAKRSKLLQLRMDGWSYTNILRPNYFQTYHLLAFSNLCQCLLSLSICFQIYFFRHPLSLTKALCRNIDLEPVLGTWRVHQWVHSWIQ